MKILSLVAAVTIFYAGPIAAFDVEFECRQAWAGSAEHMASLSKSASEQAIAKRDTIEKCIREVTATEGDDPAQELRQHLSEPPEDAPPPTDSRLLDKSWMNEWEKRWLCDGLTLYKSGDRGKVVLDGIDEIDTHFNLDGLSPRWNWNNDDDPNWENESGYRYSITLQRNQFLESWIAAFFDFNLADDDGLAEPSMTFFGCRE